MSRTRSAVPVIALSAALAACSMLPAKDHKPDPVVPRTLPPPAARTDGAIYQAGQEMALFADLKARRVGDVLTIVLNESTNASKNAATTTSKTSAVTDTGPALFGKSITTKGIPILDTTLSGSHTFDGEGTSSEGNSLVGSLTVTVMQVQANGNMVVQGDPVADAKASHARAHLHDGAGGFVAKNTRGRHGAVMENEHERQHRQN